MLILLYVSLVTLLGIGHQDSTWDHRPLVGGLSVASLATSWGVKMKQQSQHHRWVLNLCWRNAYICGWKGESWGNRYLGVLTSLCRMKRSLLPLLSMSPFQARAPTLEETELRFHILGLDGHNRRDESQRGKMLTLTVHCDQTAHWRAWQLQHPRSENVGEHE